MNKRVNTFLFLLGATIVNIVSMVVVMFGGLFLLARVLPERTQESAGRLLFILLFLGSIGVAFLVYNRIIRLISKKIDMDKYFHPIFRRRGGTGSRTGPEKQS